MGTQHNTHIANDTGDKIQVEIKHDGTTTKRFLEHREVHCEKTTHTWIEIRVMGDQGETRGLESDYSVVIKKTPDGFYKIRRVRYGTIWQEIDDKMNAK